MILLFYTCILLIVIFNIIGILMFLIGDDRNKEGIKAMAIVIILFTLLCASCLYAGLKEKEREAIVAGAAHYKTTIDKDGSVTNKFVWGPEKNP